MDDSPYTPFLACSGVPSRVHILTSCSRSTSWLFSPSPSPKSKLSWLFAGPGATAGLRDLPDRARISLSDVTRPNFSMSLLTLALGFEVRAASKYSARFLNPSFVPPSCGKMVVASLTPSRKQAAVRTSSDSKHSWLRMMQCSIASALTNAPIAHRRARERIQPCAPGPSPLVRLGSSSNALILALGEWVGLAIVDRIRKMCLSFAPWTFFSIAPRSLASFSLPGDLTGATGAECFATISRRSIASESASYRSGLPDSHSLAFVRASRYDPSARCSDARWDIRNAHHFMLLSFDFKLCRIIARPHARAVGVNVEPSRLAVPRRVSSTIW
mmetsp:Transcript_38247/g.91568  ORF Transcript_38247/g.91568 Transcript_38247/m.91568 type:complete len:329 (-) Transcript_38247:871-1857(-)